MKKYLSIALLTGSLLMSGCGDSENLVFTNTNNPTPTAAPICADDAYTTDANTALTVNAANGVLANDTPNGGTVTAFTATSTQGGTGNVNGNGSFTYTPANDFTGTDTFTYTLQNSGGQVTCTVTITVNPIDGFFVDAVNGDDGTGDFDGGLPFASIQAAVAAAPTGADIVVRPGNYTGAVNLKDGQRLLGSGSALVNAQGTVRPQLTGPVVMADDNTLDFLRIEGTNGDAIDAEGQTGGTVSTCEVLNIMAGGNGGDGIDCRDTQGTWTITNNEFTNCNGTAFGCTTTGTNSATYIYSNNVATNNGLGGWVAISEDNSDVRASVVSNTMQGNNTIAGDAFELICSDSSAFCLDLEDNVADTDSNTGNGQDGVYRVGEFNSSALRIEQFITLTDPQPGGAGNIGMVNDSSTGTIENVIDGTCGF
jgi:hypothetical protein